MSRRCTRKGWPAKAPKKGSNSRNAAIASIRGVRASELQEKFNLSSVTSWVTTLLNEKGIVIRNVKGTYLLAGFYRKNGRYREMPGFTDRAEKLLLEHEKRPYKRKTAA
jgi:hypothetical protein